MNPRLAIALAVALAAVPPAYAAFVFAWQLTDVLALTVRLMGQDIPAEFWLQVASLTVRMIGISVALFVVGRMAMQARWPMAGLALLGAWGIAAPVLMRLLDLR